MTRFRIAVTQPRIEADPLINGRVIRSLMRRSAAHGARLVQLPEGALSGYAKEQHQTWRDVDWSTVRAELDEIVELAGELGIWVVLGSAHPLTPPNRPHNSLYVVSDHGELVDRYDKRMCSDTEITHFYSPGFDACAFDVDGFRFGCLLCIEVNFPELFAEYERFGVDAVLLSAYPVDSVFAVKARALASINNYWLAISAPAQTRRLFPSAVVAPNGSCVSPVHDEGDLLIGDLDTDDPTLQGALRRARPWRAQARQGDIYASRRVDDRRSTTRTSG